VWKSRNLGKVISETLKNCFTEMSEREYRGVYFQVQVRVVAKLNDGKSSSVHVVDAII